MTDHEDTLPLADCPTCEYRESKAGHCYMFKVKPGDRCGKYRRVKSDHHEDALRAAAEAVWAFAGEAR